jgi:hypothetical protein
MTERAGTDPEEIAEADEIDEIEDDLMAHPDAPEADVIEQHQSLVPPARSEVRVAPDVPEADALEQAMPVEGDDDFVDE